MTFWQFLNQWWNLPCLVLLGLVGVSFALQGSEPRGTRRAGMGIASAG